MDSSCRACLCRCQGDVLLLRRSSTSGNANTLGLPGGNADPEDADLMATAVREAQEEMGAPLPPFTVLAPPMLTRRGKRLQKHFTVFLAAMAPEVRASWTPTLNDEHTGYEWMPLSVASGRTDLHPVVARVLQEEPHRQLVMQAAGLAS